MLIFIQRKGFSVLIGTFFISISLLFTGCASNEVVETGPEVVEVDVEAVEVDTEVVEVDAEETDPDGEVVEVDAEVIDTEVVEVDAVVDEEENEIDPYENVNRKVFVFNKTLDDYVAAPISDAYLWITPQFVQTGIGNFFSNLKDINVVLNDLMQGKLEQGAEDTGRFAINTTLGLAGLFDVATEFGLEKHEEDFAQTLAVWGVPQGPYLVLPIIGPATSRGVPGGIFDTAANPATYVGLPIQLVQMLNARANATGALKFIDEAALDPYVFTRESFLQYREHLITDGESEVGSDTLDFEDDFYDEDEFYDEDGDEVVASVEQEEGGSDVSVDMPAESPEIAKTDTENQVEKPDYRLDLSSDVDNFEQASSSFDGAVKSFDEASSSFEEAADKLNNLKP